jgi:GNAT superfamily N-acetyltransferase
MIFPHTSTKHKPSQFSTTRNRVSLTLRCRWGIKHGLFYTCKDPSSPTTPDKVLGTAMWLAPQKPNAPQSWSLYLSSWSLYLNQILMNLTYGRGGLNVKRYWLWKEAQAAAQAEIWDDPRGYYFCNIVTVLPECQGKGVGRALMEEVLGRADKEGRKCYLESSRREPNVGIYEKFGFRLVRDMVCDDGGEGIMLYCMVRDPKAVATAEEGDDHDDGVLVS